ncbi:MAG: UPF0149 family protein [Legionellales bacterium]|nr:UPF0149 family protein [Legionellales bacterium]
MPRDNLQLPILQQVDETLRQLKALSDASQAHGLMCGFICLGQRPEQMSWWEVVTDHCVTPTTLDDVVYQPLLALYGYSWECITQMNFEFQLLIPADDRDLLERAKALGSWCQGFMTGLGMAGLTHADIDAQELRDALLHISEISKVDYEHLDSSEGDEQALTELYEYIRFAVLNLYADFNAAKKHKSTPPRQTDKEKH